MPELRRRRDQPLRPGHGRRPQGRPADRLLLRHRRRLGRARWWRTARSCSRCPTPSRTRSPCCSSRSRARSTRAQRAAVAPGETVLVVGAGTVGILTLLALKLLRRARARDRRGQAPEAARSRPAGRRRRGRPPRAHREGRAAAHERGQAHARARPGVPARAAPTSRSSAPARRARSTWRSAPPRPAAAWSCPASPAAAPTSPRCGSASSSSSGAYTATGRTTFAHGDPGGRQPAASGASSSAPRIRSPAGATRSTTRCRPARSARSRWRSRPQD